MELQRFDKSEQYYLDLGGSAADAKDVTLTLAPTEIITGTVLPRTTKKIMLTEGTLNVKYNTKTASHIDITLPEDISSYFQSR